MQALKNFTLSQEVTEVSTLYNLREPQERFIRKLGKEVITQENNEENFQRTDSPAWSKKLED